MWGQFGRQDVMGEGFSKVGAGRGHFQFFFTKRMIRNQKSDSHADTPQVAPSNTVRKNVRRVRIDELGRLINFNKFGEGRVISSSRS